MLAVGTRIKNPWPTCRNEVPGRYQREFGTFRNIDNTDGSSATVEIGTPVQGITMQPYGDWGFRSAPFSTPGVVRTLVVSPAIYNPTCKWIDTHQLPYPSTSPNPTAPYYSWRFDCRSVLDGWNYATQKGDDTQSGEKGRAVWLAGNEMQSEECWRRNPEDGRGAHHANILRVRCCTSPYTKHLAERCVRVSDEHWMGSPTDNGMVLTQGWENYANSGWNYHFVSGGLMCPLVNDPPASSSLSLEVDCGYRTADSCSACTEQVPAFWRAWYCGGECFWDTESGVCLSKTCKQELLSRSCGGACPEDVTSAGSNTHSTPMVKLQMPEATECIERTSSPTPCVAHTSRCHARGDPGCCGYWMIHYDGGGAYTCSLLRGYGYSCSGSCGCT